MSRWVLSLSFHWIPLLIKETFRHANRVANSLRSYLAISKQASASEHSMDLPKLKLALEKASKVDTLRQATLAKPHPPTGSYPTEIPDFEIDVDALYAAAAVLWSDDTVSTGAFTSASYWPVQATAAMHIGEILKATRSFEYRPEPFLNTSEDQSLQYHMMDEDGVFQILVDAGLAERLVKLLSTPHDSTPAEIPPDLDMFDRTFIFTRSSAIQFCVCSVSVCNCDV